MYELMNKNFTELKFFMTMGIMCVFHLKAFLCSLQWCVGMALVPLRKQILDLGQLESLNIYYKTNDILKEYLFMLLLQEKRLGKQHPRHRNKGQ